MSNREIRRKSSAAMDVGGKAIKSRKGFARSCDGNLSEKGKQGSSSARAGGYDVSSSPPSLSSSVEETGSFEEPPPHMPVSASYFDLPDDGDEFGGVEEDIAVQQFLLSQFASPSSSSRKGRKK